MTQKLQQAIQAARAGESKKAQYLLSQSLQEDPEDVQSWYLLSLLVDSEAKQVAYLQRVVALDPTHEKAQARLAELTAPAPVAVQEPDASPDCDWLTDEAIWGGETADTSEPELTEPTSEYTETTTLISEPAEESEESPVSEATPAVAAAKPRKAPEKPAAKTTISDNQLAKILYVLIGLAVVVGLVLIYVLFFLL